jgi:hypothetical protein
MWNRALRPRSVTLAQEEITLRLRQALQHLKRIGTRKRLPLMRLRHFRALAAVPDSARPYLERMRLDAPRSLRERLLQRALVYALVSIDVI